MGVGGASLRVAAGNYGRRRQLKMKHCAQMSHSRAVTERSARGGGGQAVTADERMTTLSAVMIVASAGRCAPIAEL